MRVLPDGTAVAPWLEVAISGALIVGGKTYIPLEALQAAGVKVVRSSAGLNVTLPTVATATGGANARPSLEGCLGETLFNGVWRVKALKLEAIKTDRPGWGLTIELRNGTKATIAPWEAGWVTKGVQLAFGGATTVSVDGMDVQKVTFATLPAGGAVTHQLKFFYPFGTPEAEVKKPTKFLTPRVPDFTELDRIRSIGRGNPLRRWMNPERPDGIR